MRLAWHPSNHVASARSKSPATPLRRASSTTSSHSSSPSQPKRRVRCPAMKPTMSSPPLATRTTRGASGVTVHPVRVWGFSLNVPSGEFSLDRFSAVGLAERIVVVRPVSIPGDTGSVQLLGRPGTPNIEVMIDDIDTARGFAEELSATLHLELTSVAVPGQTIRRYTV